MIKKLLNFLKNKIETLNGDVSILCFDLFNTNTLVCEYATWYNFNSKNFVNTTNQKYFKNWRFRENDKENKCNLCSKR